MPRSTPHCPEARSQHAAVVGPPPGLYTEQELNKLLRRLSPGRGRRSAGIVVGLCEQWLRTGHMRLVDFKKIDGTHRKRYALGRLSHLDVALAFAGGGYLSHRTAAMIHGLLDGAANAIVVNREQTPKPCREDALEQQRIDATFRGRPRMTSEVHVFEKCRLTLVRGKHTKNLQVQTTRGPEGEQLPVTGIERTLIDVAVSPHYGGGPRAILEMYRAAKGRASSAVLAEILVKLNYVYPHRQRIGFYMSKAGYAGSDLAPLRRPSFTHDFYLAHEMGAMRYVPEWRLHVPRGL